MDTNSISRKKFLKAAGLTGAVFFLGMYFPASAKVATLLTDTEAETADLDAIEMNAWILIETSGKVTLVCHRAEMGQGVYHSIAQIIAEELEVDLADVRVVFAQGNNKKYGSQITGGSSTIRGSYKNLLNLSASAREMLITAAALKWSVPPSECHAAAGHVLHSKSRRKAHFGELVATASKLEVPKNVALKKRSDYKLISKPLHRLDTPSKTNGSAVFGLDKKIPGMLYAAVERNPRLRGKIKSFDASATLKVPGVKRVFKVKMLVFATTREGVAVVADSTWAAMQGKKALKVEWDDSGFDHINTASIYQRQEELLKSSEGLQFSSQGDPGGVIAQSGSSLDVIYQTPYQYHA